MTTTAVIGTGYWGKNLVRVFYRLPESDLTYICDTVNHNLEAVGKSYPGVKLTQDYREVLGDDRVEAVAITTPAASSPIPARGRGLRASRTAAISPAAASTARKGVRGTKYRMNRSFAIPTKPR